MVYGEKIDGMVRVYDDMEKMYNGIVKMYDGTERNMMVLEFQGPTGP